MASTKVSQTSTSRKGEVGMLARQCEVRSPQHPGPVWLAPPCQEGTGDLRPSSPPRGRQCRAVGCGMLENQVPKHPSHSTPLPRRPWILGFPMAAGLLFDEIKRKSDRTLGGEHFRP